MLSKKIMIRNSTAEFLIFTNQTGKNHIEVRYEDEVIWLSQKLMAELFQVKIPTINEHIKKIFESGELDEDSVIRKFLITAPDSKDYLTKFYNLDMIISVGYRVNSRRATEFRRWATNILREFAIKGYAMDKERLENGSFLGKDYFEQLLSEIREIRLSERRFYQKITDIYASSVDYDKNSKLTKDFFAKVQNKLHYAITGLTASELIKNRANSKKDNMGLTSWGKSPDGKILKTDITIAKNYLQKDELDSLGRIVNAYLDLAEDRAKRQIPMSMEDWVIRLDKFLDFNDREVLQNAGKISSEVAKNYAKSEFEKYRIIQDRIFISDFDKINNEIDRDLTEDIKELKDLEEALINKD